MKVIPGTPAAAVAIVPKGPRPLTRLTDPDRILHPLKRVGERGAGNWEKVTWDEVLDDIAGTYPQSIEGRQPQ